MRLPAESTPASLAQAAARLLQLPTELLSDVMSHLDTTEIGCLAATCRSIWFDAPTAPPPQLPPREIGLVEAELRRRAKARGLATASSLPDGNLPWLSYLLKTDRRDALRRQVQLAVGCTNSIFVDRAGRQLTCGTESGDAHVLGHAVDIDANPDEHRKIDMPTLVPSMQERRIVCVSCSLFHCLALSVEGEVYAC